jgi:hypothetical protein
MRATSSRASRATFLPTWRSTRRSSRITRSFSARDMIRRLEGLLANDARALAEGDASIAQLRSRAMRRAVSARSARMFVPP